MKRFMLILAAATCAMAQVDSPGVSVDLGGASVLHRTGVSYPRTALTNHVTGTLTVDVTLDGKGEVTDTRVVSGPEELRAAALQSVLQWHFTRDAAGSHRQVTINFQTPPDKPAGVLGGIVGSIPSRTPAVMNGRTVRSVNVSGLSDQAKNDLLSRLPLREGATINDDVIARSEQIVKDYDEHLMINVLPMRDSDAVVIVRAPGGVPTPIPALHENAETGPDRIKVGGNVQQAKLIRQPRPMYPPDAKAARIQGVVKFAVVINKDGTMKSIEVISGHPLLVPAAMEAVQQWVYEPTLLNGQPVEVITQIDVNFTLSQ